MNVEEMRTEGSGTLQKTHTGKDMRVSAPWNLHMVGQAEVIAK